MKKKRKRKGKEEEKGGIYSRWGKGTSQARGQVTNKKRDMFESFAWFAPPLESVASGVKRTGLLWAN
jgi:hypothetical protein